MSEALAAAAAALRLSFGLIIPCDLPPGTPIVAVNLTVANGNPAVLSLSAGDLDDFTINGTNIVVGDAGISPDRCGSTQSLKVTATQQ